MNRINFTKEHFAKLQSLAVEMLFNNECVGTKMGQTLSISELLHVVTINSLNSIRIHLAKKIEDAENKDEWISDANDQKYLNMLKKQKDLVNLIIGYKRWLLENETIKREREKLEMELHTLKESQKTPEDKIREIEEKIANLNSSTF